MIMFIPAGLLAVFYGFLCMQDFAFEKREEQKKDRKRKLKSHRSLNELVW